MLVCAVYLAVCSDQSVPAPRRNRISSVIAGARQDLAEPNHRVPRSTEGTAVRYNPSGDDIPSRFKSKSEPRLPRSSKVSAPVRRNALKKLATKNTPKLSNALPKITAPNPELTPHRAPVAHRVRKVDPVRNSAIDDMIIRMGEVQSDIEVMKQAKRRKVSGVDHPKESTKNDRVLKTEHVPEDATGAPGELLEPSGSRVGKLLHEGQEFIWVDLDTSTRTVLDKESIAPGEDSAIVLSGLLNSLKVKFNAISDSVLAFHEQLQHPLSTKKPICAPFYEFKSAVAFIMNPKSGLPQPKDSSDTTPIFESGEFFRILQQALISMRSDPSCTATLYENKLSVPSLRDLEKQLAQFRMVLRPSLASEFAVTHHHDVSAENVVSFYSPSGFQFYKLDTTPDVIRDLLHSGGPIETG